MTQTMTLPARTEIVEFDQDVLSALCATHGAAAETYLTECLTQIGHRMDSAALHLRHGETVALGHVCADLVVLAETIGMRTLAAAAGAVRAAIAARDATALAACGTRMVRLAHPAAFENWAVRPAC